MNHTELIAYILERDGYRCCDCGAPGTEVHHILSRRYKQAWDQRNMILLCPECHRLRDKQSGAHTTEAKARHLRYLQDRFGYDYSDMPFKGMILEDVAA